MAFPTMRSIACAAVLAAGLLPAGAGGVASADPADASAAGPDSAGTTSKHNESNTPSGGHAAGNRDGTTSASSEPENKKTGPLVPAPKFSGSITIPIPHIPNRGQLPASGLPNPTLFYTTVVIPVPTLGDVFAALQPPPTPTPTPTPATAPVLRVQGKLPGVVDSGGGGGEGGGDGALSVATAEVPQVLHSPIVVVSAPVPVARAFDVAPGAAPKRARPPETASAGVNAPLLTGSLPPSTQPATKLLTPTNGRPTRAGYSRYARTPTSVELAVVALPGVAGLLFFTFGGGVIGFRQANSVRFLRAQGDARFLR